MSAQYAIGDRVRFFEAGEVRDAGTVTAVEDGGLFRVKWDEAPFSSYTELAYTVNELVPASIPRNDGGYNDG